MLIEGLKPNDNTVSLFLFLVSTCAHPERGGDAEAYTNLRRRQNWNDKLQSLECLDYEVIDNKRFDAPDLSFPTSHPSGLFFILALFGILFAFRLFRRHYTQQEYHTVLRRISPSRHRKKLSADEPVFLVLVLVLVVHIPPSSDAVPVSFFLSDSGRLAATPPRLPNG